MPRSVPVPSADARSVGNAVTGVTSTLPVAVALRLPSVTLTVNVTVPVRFAYQVTTPLLGFSTAPAGPATNEYWSAWDGTSGSAPMACKDTDEPAATVPRPFN